MRRVLTISIAALAIGVSLGALVPMHDGPTELHAQQSEVCAAHTPCENDSTVTSALSVTHRYRGEPVAEWISETWEITAIWATEENAPDACDCEIEKTHTVYATVSTVDGLNVSCSGCTGGLIEDVDVCPEAGCEDSGGTKHYWDYRLIVDVDEHDEVPCPYPGDPNNIEPIHLYSVTYELDGGSDGQVVDTSDCTLGAEKELIGGVDPETDYGAFECPFDCDAVGVSIGLDYQDP